MQGKRERAPLGFWVACATFPMPLLALWVACLFPAGTLSGMLTFFVYVGAALCGLAQFFLLWNTAYARSLPLPRRLSSILSTAIAMSVLWGLTIWLLLAVLVGATSTKPIEVEVPYKYSGKSKSCHFLVKFDDGYVGTIEYCAEDVVGIKNSGVLIVSEKRGPLGIFIKQVKVKFS
jgi:hypothetical protein